jgi:hypothetical protein
MAIEAALGTSAIEPKRGWLHGPVVDLLILLGPWLFLLGALLIGAGTPKSVWLAQFVLGNTTHVILTFLLLATRRDILRATPTQAKTVVIGSIVTFVLIYALLAVVNENAPYWLDFPVAMVTIFGIHHRLSQARGIWSLYNMAGSNMGPPSALERTLHTHWTSVGLILVCTNWLFVPTAANRSFSLAHPIPQMEAPLPYFTAYVLAGIWIVFALFVGRTLWKGGARLPKMLHVATHACAITLAILSPVWGSVVWGAIHGLEYYFLCARMMQPRSGEESGIPRWIVWPLIFAAMAPLFFVGWVQSPFRADPASPAFQHALFATNALVVAHYFADAFIYRFRIPSVRRVALFRLGFSQS